MKLSFHCIFLLAVITISSSVCQAKDRIYFLAIKEIIWDYAPTGLNVLTGNKLEDEKIPKIYSNMYIGKKYKKAVYRRYTDKTFQTEIPHDPNLGFMGPTIRAEVGDRIILHLFNNATKNYSAHPHGVFYTKSNEGAFYGDNSTLKADDRIPPGGRYTYEWEVLPQYGPAPNDPNCLTWAYHSHTHSPVDINSGLIGALIVCRPGTYREDETRSDVDHEFVAMFFIPYERDTWYFWENLEIFLPGQTVDINEKYFIKGNKMHAINGYIYGNVPGYQVCQGDTVSWHIMGMGSNRDLHPMHFQGQTVMHQHHTKDSFIFIPATFSTAVMRADNPGRWAIACKLYSHFTEGMTATFEVDPVCRNPDNPLPSESLTGNVREYFIAAEEILWNYGPSGKNGVTGKNLTDPDTGSATFFEKNPSRIGGVYKKAVFRGYTSASFTDPTPREDDWGILGPPLFVEVGDTVKVLFNNKVPSHAFNIEPHGVYFSEAHSVLPHSKHLYVWTVPDTVAPGENDPNCITYPYTSSVEYISDSNSGLVGPLIVCKRGTLKTEMKKQRKYVMITVCNEGKSWYIDENIKLFTEPGSVNKKSGDFKESNNMHSINGLMYGNLKLNLCVNQDTIFHFIVVGTKFDIHSLKFDGINVKIDGVSSGTVNLFPHQGKTVMVHPEHVGSGAFFCAVIDHLEGGMTAIYNASTCNEADLDGEDSSSAIRQYYIAAEETIWDYNTRRVNIDGDSVDVEGNHGYDHAHRDPGKTIGSIYKKVLYYEYTDETFTERKSKDAHLGFLGPIIEAEVGDTIKVTFLNRASRSYNMFPWGAVDPSNVNIYHDPVAPGESKEYVWEVPQSASPTENQPGCLSFIYVSTVDRARDVPDGLMGPLKVCRRGEMGSNNVDKEFFLQFQVVDENLSHYIDENIEEYVGVEASSFDKENKAFVESNKMKAINGYLSHVDGLVMRKNDLVRWHLIGWGNEKDYHSIHFHAHTYVHISDGIYRGDVYDLYPGSVGTVDMVPIAPGSWLLHCHVFDHMHGGMETTYTVLDNENDQDTNATQKHIRNECSVDKNGHKYLLSCSRMNLRRAADLIPTKKRRLLCLNSHGRSIRVPTKRVTSLDLSYNLLNENELRKVLRFFPYVRVLRLNGNPIRILAPSLIGRNKMLSTLVVRNTPSLQVVSTNLLRGKPIRNIPDRDFDLLDLSNNDQLSPACLSHLFISMDRFGKCTRSG